MILRRPALPTALAKVVIPTWTVGGLICLAALALATDTDRPEAWRLLLAAALILVGEAPLLSVRLGSHLEVFTFGDAALIVGLVLLPGPGWC